MLDFIIFYTAGGLCAYVCTELLHVNEFNALQATLALAVPCALGAPEAYIDFMTGVAAYNTIKFLL